ncbi:MAG TPA: gliding motility-associated C-terminal domain-containing protein [Bacteroidia bacterium]|nr:gliding motility-associated C-terminal domain-containing protein [Bacteroidia bacterium]
MNRNIINLSLVVFCIFFIRTNEIKAQCNNIFQFTVLATPATCLLADGNIGITNVTGGSGVYTFSLLSGPATGPSVPPNNHAFPNLSAGVYSFTISDGTCDTTVSVTVEITGSITSASAITTPTSCTGSTGTITVSHQPAAVNVVNYILTPPNAPNNATGVFTALPAGNYSVVLEDANNCPFTINGIVINAPAPITNADIVVTPIVCKGALGVIEVNGVTGGTAPFQYQFDNNPFSGTSTFTDVLQGVHAINIIDANGCTYTEGVMMTGSTTELKDCSAGKDTTIFFGENAPLSAIKGVGSKFFWSPGDLLDDSLLLNPTAFPRTTTTYTFTTKTAEGCTCIDRVTVRVVPLIKIPNTFTPNQDGTNDIWIIENTELYEEVELNIFNRWGDKVYYKKDYKAGTDEWTGGSLPPATYYYVLRFKYPNNDERFEYTGGITLIR